MRTRAPYPSGSGARISKPSASATYTRQLFVDAVRKVRQCALVIAILDRGSALLGNRLVEQRLRNHLAREQIFVTGALLQCHVVHGAKLRVGFRDHALLCLQRLQRGLLFGNVGFTFLDAQFE
ncbi:MAG: hypothetical protein NT024_09280, partial [Proteobacteria bacterium]|nr:hypothetical protein [Pseudomonadota bacterium]